MQIARPNLTVITAMYKHRFPTTLTHDREPPPSSTGDVTDNGVLGPLLPAQLSPVIAFFLDNWLMFNVMEKWRIRQYTRVLLNISQSENKIIALRQLYIYVH